MLQHIQEADCMLEFSVPVAVRWDFCLLWGEHHLSAEKWTNNRVLFLYSGSEKGSSVTETPVIKKHNGLHLMLPDAHDTECGEETRFVLSHPKSLLFQERNVLVSWVSMVGSTSVPGCITGQVLRRFSPVSAIEDFTGLSVPWLLHA